MRHRLLVTAASGLAVWLFSAPSFAQTTEIRGLSNFERNEPPKDAGPAPRLPNGRIMIGGGNDKGLWTPLFSTANPILEFEKVPFQPWAKALYVDRQKHELEPHTRCKASGVARQFLTPYGVEFVELGDRIYIFDEGGPHTFRIVYMDGRTHPKNADPTYYGHSVGWWEGDTLVVESTGYNERFWLDRRGLPHTEKLRTLERFTRISALGMKYEVTVDDPNVYTQPWTGYFFMRFNPDLEPWEYVCQQANYAHELMVGNMDTVDRSTTIVP
ncbi:MAG TPA: hypothetical protein VM818_20860 [Vicinamibacterales bacterium]|jgi:hypothetical protein|nr:hypothetical protein [Vicinamibacterales bacterium]